MNLNDMKGKVGEEFITLILSMDNKLFDKVYSPEKRDEILKEFISSDEARESLSQDLQSVSKKEMLSQIDDMIFGMEFTKEEMADANLSESKIQFLKDIFQGMKTIVNELSPRKQVKVAIQTLIPAATLPIYAHDTDAGMDVASIENKILLPNETYVFKLGFKLAIPVGYEVQIRPRSGLSLKTGLRVANAPGTIDAGYRDEVGVIITNTGKDNYIVNKGDRIAQMVIQESPMIYFEQVEDVTKIGEDRNGGLGSTGK